jgi:hypothetical protein
MSTAAPNIEPVRFIPTDKQKEAHQLLKVNDVVLYGGAIRGAKSYWGGLEITGFCHTWDNSRWFMMRKDRVVLESTLLKTYVENFLDLGWSAYVKSFTQDDLVLTWNNNSQILFMGENYDRDKELNRFKGLEINGGFIDEINETQEVTYDKVIERAGSWFHAKPALINGVLVKCPSKVLASCNPTQGWVKRRFYEPWERGELPDRVAYIQAKITDNPYVPAEYLESIKKLPRYQYKVFVEGDWNVALKMGGEFYKTFELDQHVFSDVTVKYNPDLPLHISFDDNVNPYLPAGIFQFTRIVEKNDKGELIPVGYMVDMIDEIAGVTPRNTVAQVCNEIKRLYPGHKAGMFIYGDATASKEDTKLEKGFNFYRLILDALKEYKPGLRVLKSNPSVIMRGMWINTIFENEIGGLKIRISEKCKKTINDFVLLKEDEEGGKFKETETKVIGDSKVRYQKVGHFTDLFDYLLCAAFAQKFAEYQAGGAVQSIKSGRKAASKNAY